MRVRLIVRMSFTHSTLLSMMRFVRAAVLTSALGIFALGTLSAQASARQATVPAGMRLATFAGGCFWCMEHPFDALPGVSRVTSGYTGGQTVNPTYEQVSAGTTGHTEAVQIVYDPGKITYERLLDIFWHNIDPVTPNAQFCDQGSQYRSGVFAHDAAQLRAAEQSKAALVASRVLREPIVTQIVGATAFYAAEEYHQQYYKKNPVRYRFYRWNCGRDQRLRELWGAAAPTPEPRP
jgi:peptide-methionine (S)-S-oxide reductase